MSKNFVRRHKLTLYFTIVLIISWSIWIPMALDHLNIIEFPIPLIVGQTLGALGIIITLIILEKTTNKEVNVNKIFSTIRLKKAHTLWFVLAAFTIPLLTILGNFLNFIAGIDPQFVVFQQSPLELLGFGLIGVIPLTFFAMLFSSPLLEEPGWRGFAMNELQSKFGKHIGSFLLGSFWWMWHLPLYVIYELEINVFSYLIMVLHSFMYDSLCNLSEKNLLTAMFTHSSDIIVSYYIFSGSASIFAFLVFLIAVIALRVLEWKKQDKSLNLEQKE